MVLLARPFARVLPLALVAALALLALPDPAGSAPGRAMATR